MTWWTMTKEYDRHFQLYAFLYFDGLVDWPWFKAQGIAESGLDMDAVSNRGARGIMQLMPGTTQDIAKALQIIPNINDPKTNIHFGIRYARQMWDIFKKETGIERLRFALGAYNAGAGNIIKAQGLTDRPNSWEAVSFELENVTGAANSHQTRSYVKKIEDIRLQIIDA